jgi:predicted enzyme related to lactoylglutathione lyase
MAWLEWIPGWAWILIILAAILIVYGFFNRRWLAEERREAEERHNTAVAASSERAQAAQLTVRPANAAEVGAPMIASARYAHTNLIARDWRSLAGFYQRVFGCTPKPPERDFQGEWLEAGTGIPGAQLNGMHLRLPGWGEDGPTLEIFTYQPQLDALPAAANRPGFAHIAFEVPDVPAARAAVLAAGGRAVGQVVTLTVADGRAVTWCYVCDPEGNQIELQSWELA